MPSINAGCSLSLSVFLCSLSVSLCLFVSLFLSLSVGEVRALQSKQGWTACGYVAFGSSFNCRHQRVWKRFGGRGVRRRVTRSPARAAGLDVGDDEALLREAAHQLALRGQGKGSRPSQSESLTPPLRPPPPHTLSLLLALLS